VVKLVTEEHAILVIYDFDQTLTKRHTEGALFQHDFETPYLANLRAPRYVAHHLAQLQQSETPRIITGIATFGQNRQRIVDSCKALGLDEESLLICAESVATRRIAKRQGKNLHIAKILQEHYAKNPHIRISHVVLADDDADNIHVLDDYANFLSNTSPWNEDERLNIPVHGILAPTPELLTCMEIPEKGFPRRVLKMKYDEALQKDVCCESPESGLKFLQLLNAVEKKIVAIQLSEQPNYFTTHNRNLQFARPKCPQQNPLTLSYDETMQRQLDQEEMAMAAAIEGNESPVLNRSLS
jgi:hypothetical protein